jgi:hypothetical protein
MVETLPLGCIAPVGRGRVMPVPINERTALVLLRLRTGRAASATTIAADLGLDVDEVLLICEALRAAGLIGDVPPRD